MTRPKRGISHKKELYYIFCIAAVMAIVFLSLLGPGGYRDLQKARKQVEEQRARVNNIRRSNSELVKTIEALQSDKKAVEKIARENGYAKPDEIIQQIHSSAEPAK